MDLQCTYSDSGLGKKNLSVLKYSVTVKMTVLSIDCSINDISCEHAFEMGMLTTGLVMLSNEISTCNQLTHDKLSNSTYVCLLNIQCLSGETMDFAKQTYFPV